MSMTLGDAFNRRKKLGADLNSWVNRLRNAGADRRSYRTKGIEGDGAFTPEPGSDRLTMRHYSVEECRENIASILEEDQQLAFRISLTNQAARASVQLLDGTTRELSVPELLVLKGDIIPKLEAAARAVPTVAEGVSVFESGEGWLKHRSLAKIERTRQTLSEKGMKIEETEVTGYDVVETTDYGIPQRDAWNEIDRIQDFAQRVKQAVNAANKTELITLDASGD